jgi:ribosomal-protein-alanine N-acetyltransferase
MPAVPGPTERLCFRRWTDCDPSLAALLWQDPEVMRFMGGPYTQEEVDARLAREAANETERALQYWPVFLRDSEVFTGCCGLKPKVSAPEILEIGFHFLPAFWGAGYGAEAARAVMQFAEETLGIRELYAGHHPQNSASRRLLEKLGFAQIGEHLFARTGLQHPWLQWKA